MPGECGPSSSLLSLHLPAPQAASLHSPAQTGQIVTAEWRKCSLLKLSTFSLTLTCQAVLCSCVRAPALRGGFGCISAVDSAVLWHKPLLALVLSFFIRCFQRPFPLGSAQLQPPLLQFCSFSTWAGVSFQGHRGVGASFVFLLYGFCCHLIVNVPGLQN